MASYHKAIADAARGVVAALSGAPDIVVVRDTDVAHSDEIPCVIVTMGDVDEALSVSGAGSSTDQGDVCEMYQVGFSIYRANLAANQAGLDTNPDFVLRAQQALNKTTLAGVSGVYGTRLVRRDSWENQPFAKGVEKSVFGVVFLHARTRLGN
jgi:hypothetical protein